MELKLKIKKRSPETWLVWFVFMMPFLFGVLTEFLGLPSILRYTVDVAWVGILIITVFGNRITVYKSTAILFLWVLLFFGSTILVYMFNYQSVLYYLWGFRNNFRMYAFFIGCVLFFCREDIDSCIDWFDRIFYINCAVALFQYFLLDLRQDFLGGIFGAQGGCNGWLNIFQVAVITKTVVYYLNKKESLRMTVIKSILALVIAAFAELRFFFIEFGVIVAVAVLITSFSWRKVAVIAVTVGGLFVGIRLLVDVFPQFAEYMTLESFYNSASAETGYTSTGDMNRLTSLSMISDLFLKTDLKRFFGMGLGNCDYAEAFNFITSPFYLKNADYHYTWLSVAFLFLETGFTGLIFFFGFFVLVFVFALKRMKKAEKIYCQISMITAVLCVLIGVYNSTLRTEAAFMLYFLMALPFIRNRSKGSEAE